MRAEFLQKRLISAFFGFQWLNLAEILHLFKKYNNVGKVAVKRVSLTDYALWTLGSLDALVKKSSFPFHRSDYLCRESVDAAITHFFVANVAFTCFFVENVVITRFLTLNFTQNFWKKSSEIRRILAENLRKKLAVGASGRGVNNKTKWLERAPKM